MEELIEIFLMVEMLPEHFHQLIMERVPKN